MASLFPAEIVCGITLDEKEATGLEKTGAYDSIARDAYSCFALLSHHDNISDPPLPRVIPYFDPRSPLILRKNNDDKENNNPWDHPASLLHPSRRLRGNGGRERGETHKRGRKKKDNIEARQGGNLDFTDRASTSGKLVPLHFERQSWIFCRSLSWTVADRSWHTSPFLLY